MVPSEIGGQNVDVSSNGEEKVDDKMKVLKDKIQACMDKKEKLLAEIKEVMAMAKKLQHPAWKKCYWTFML